MIKRFVTDGKKKNYIYKQDKVYGKDRLLTALKAKETLQKIIGNINIKLLANIKNYDLYYRLPFGAYTDNLKDEYHQSDIIKESINEYIKNYNDYVDKNNIETGKIKLENFKVEHSSNFEEVTARAGIIGTLNFSDRGISKVSEVLPDPAIFRIDNIQGDLILSGNNLTNLDDLNIEIISGSLICDNNKVKLIAPSNVIYKKFIN